jgi:hypothetical protein
MNLHGTSRLLLAGVAVLAGAAASVAVAAPAQAVVGLVVVNGWSAATGSESFKSAVAVCPAGTKVLGGGADIIDGGHEVRLSSVVPAAARFPTHSIYATAMEDGSYAANWTMYAWASCGSGVTGWEIVTNSFMVDENASDLSVFAECPGGKKVIGAGGATIGGYPYILEAVKPATGLTGAWAVVTGDESTPIPGSTWGARSFAICINPVAAQQLISRTTLATSDDKHISLSCPTGTKLHSSGAGLSTGASSGEVYLDKIGLYGRSVYSADIDAHEDQTGYTGTWQLTVYAICAA